MERREFLKAGAAAALATGPNRVIAADEGKALRVGLIGAGWYGKTDLFHLIREAGLEAALASFPNPEAIPERNMDRMREIGLAELKRRLAALKQNNEGDSA